MDGKSYMQPIANLYVALSLTSFDMAHFGHANALRQVIITLYLL